MRILTIVAACFLTLSAAVDSVVGETSESSNIDREIIHSISDIYSESHALVIGVADYEFWDRLGSVPQEVDKVRTALIEQGFEVQKLINPDGETMHRALRQFFNTYGLDEENRLLLFFSGHGYNRPGRKEGYLVPADAPDPSQGKESMKAFIRKSVNMEQIMAWSKTVEARHVMFVFDSCFSGSIFWKKSAPPPPPDIEICLGNPVRQFITAGGENEEVPGKSIFSPVFVNGIRGDGDLNGDGYVTGTELYQYIRHEVAYQGVKQTPLEGKFSPEPTKGDFIFIAGNVPPQKIQRAASLNANRVKETFNQRVGIAMGYTRFEDMDKISYYLLGAAYARRFPIGHLDLTLMTSVNSDETCEVGDAEIRFGRALYLAGGFAYPFRLGKGISLLLGVGYERLEIDLKVNNRADDLTKNSVLIGGGLEYAFKRFFSEMKVNAVFGEDKHLGHNLELSFKTGLNF